MPIPVSIQRVARNGLVAIIIALAVVMTAAVPAHATSDTVSAVEGASFSGQIGSYGAQCVGAQLSDLQVTVVWGDGVTAAGTATLSGNVIDVSGTHTYQTAGSYSGSFTGTYDCGARSGPSFAGTFTASVSDAVLSATGASVLATSGTPFSGSVASFTDASPGAAAADFAATIDWGDGSRTAGTVSASAGGGFAVAGMHTYGTSSSTPLTVVVTIQDGGGASATA